MKSKDEIRDFNNVGSSDYAERDDIHAAMDEYAKQTSVAFGEFLKDNSYTKGKDGWYQYYLKIEDHKNFSMSMPVYSFLTLDEIYSLFLEQYKHK